MFSSSPTAISEITVDEPPNDTSGSVTPVYGSELVTTAMLTSACSVSMQVRPVAKSRPNASGARQAIRKPRQASTPNSNSTPDAADEAELLADDREDRVGVRVGHPVELLQAVAQPVPERPARAERDQPLRRVPAAALDVAPRIEEGADALELIPAQVRQQRRRRAATPPSATQRDVQQVGARRRRTRTPRRRR